MTIELQMLFYTSYALADCEAFHAVVEHRNGQPALRRPRQRGCRRAWPLPHPASTRGGLSGHQEPPQGPWFSFQAVRRRFERSRGRPNVLPATLRSHNPHDRRSAGRRNVRRFPEPGGRLRSGPPGGARGRGLRLGYLQSSLERLGPGRLPHISRKYAKSSLSTRWSWSKSHTKQPALAPTPGRLMQSRK
jgi:hypothetical protein